MVTCGSCLRSAIAMDGRTGRLVRSVAGSSGSCRRSLPSLHGEQTKTYRGPRSGAVARTNRDGKSWQRIERQRLAQIEQARVTRLLEEVAAWRLAGDVDEYVATLRSRLHELEAEDRDRISAWCDWAEDWRRRTDPGLRHSLVRGLLEDELRPWASATLGSRWLT